MAYASSVVRVTIFGDMYNGAEEWSTGFYLGYEDGDGGGLFGINQAAVDSMLPYWSTFFSHADTAISSYFRCIGIKAAVMLPNGKTDLDTVTTSTYGTPIVGQSQSFHNPPQVALVAQLAAASPRGLGSKGRMFLPGVSTTVNGNGHVPNTVTQKIATGLKTFFDAVNADADMPGYLINASKGRIGIPAGAPTNKRVASIRVGDVYDTQRRRRNALTESYVSGVLA